MVTLFVSNAPGCTDSFSRTVYIPGPRDVEVPNVFTPNGDGINDFFKLRGTSVPENEFISIQIFNRWGTLVFEAGSPGFKWDGRSHDGLCATGVYYWVITTQKEQLKGFLTLK